MHGQKKRILGTFVYFSQMKRYLRLSKKSSVFVNYVTIYVLFVLYVYYLYKKRYTCHN